MKPSPGGMGVMQLRGIVRQALSGPQVFMVSMHLLRVVLLGGYLFASTRLLGPAGYGLLATATALAAIGSTLVGLGSGIGLVRRAARDPTVFPEAWAACLAQHVATGGVLLLFYASFAGRWLDMPLMWRALLPIGMTELILVPLCSATSYAFIARVQYRRSAVIQLLPALARLIGVGILWQHTGWVEIALFAQVTLLVMTLACGVALALAGALLPRPQRQGIGLMLKPDYSVVYAGSNLINTLSGEADKLVVFRLSSAHATGVYSATMRIMSAIAVPFGALIQSRSQALFALGDRIGPDHMGFLRRYGLAFSAYSLSSVFAVNLAAAWLTSLLGPGFEHASTLVFVLSLWIPANGFRQLAGAVLTTSDNAWKRAFSDIFSVCVFLGAALLLIPKFGMLGAAQARVAGELAGLLASLFALRLSDKADP